MIGPSNSVAIQTRQPRKFDFQKLRHTTPAQRYARSSVPLRKNTRNRSLTLFELANLACKRPTHALGSQLVADPASTNGTDDAGRGKQIPKKKLKLPRSPHRVP